MKHLRLKININHFFEKYNKKPHNTNHDAYTYTIDDAKEELTFEGTYIQSKELLKKYILDNNIDCKIVYLIY